MSGRTHKGATKTKQKQNRAGPNKTGIKQARAKQNSRDSRTDREHQERSDGAARELVREPASGRGVVPWEQARERTLARDCLHVMACCERCEAHD